MSDTKITKVQHLFDEATQRWFSKFRAPGIEGQAIETLIPREESSSTKVLAQLRGAGADIVLNDETKRAAVVAMESDAPIVYRAARTGWRQDWEVFVSPLGVDGSDNLASGVLPPKDAAANVGGMIRLLGNLQGWQQMMEAARYSTAWMLCLGAIFAAPLLALVDRPNFAIMLYGRSRSAKSSVQLAAASALGFGREDDLPTLNATEAGLLAAACACNDHAFIINEVGTAKGGKKEVGSKIFSSTYALMSGKDVLRFPGWNSSASNTPATFRTIVVVSSEFSPDEWAAREGLTRDPGETARMIGVPAVTDGSVSVFDLWPAAEGLTEAEWVGDQLGRLKEGLPHHTGWAFKEFVAHIVHYRAQVKEDARRRIMNFEDQLLPHATSPIAKDITSKFGVLHAGAQAAIDSGVLTLDRRTIAQAVKRGCLAALRTLPDPQRDLRESLATLVLRLESGGIVDKDSITNKQITLMRNADGFKFRRDPGQVFVVLAKVFSVWFDSPSRYRILLEWLDDNGFLEHHNDRSVGRSNQWAHGFPRWPDGTKQRSVTLYLPNGVSDLKIPKGR